MFKNSKGSDEKVILDPILKALEEVKITENIKTPALPEYVGGGVVLLFESEE